MHPNGFTNRTASKNWTNIQTIHGRPLLILASLWLLARLLPFTGLLPLAALADTAFLCWLTYEITRLVIKAKKWNQSAIGGKIALLIPANIVFYTHGNSKFGFLKIHNSLIFK
ncbi:NnrS family protein [Thiothrix nivea]|uniref:NnrS family protein n=1 Tax=Thiothrix nivea TaxID=1031 RepID=UPI0009D9C271|nr:NnrS family protein [Thiothrix nivea]